MEKKRQYQSGCCKRKRQAENEISRKKLKDSMQNFLFGKKPETLLETDRYVPVPNDHQNKNDTCVPNDEFPKDNQLTVDSCVPIPGDHQNYNKDICVPNDEFPEDNQLTVDTAFCNVGEIQANTSSCNNDSGDSVETDSGPSASNTDPVYNYNDVALWPPVSDTLREFFILNKPCQNIDYLENSTRTLGGKERMCSSNNFFRVKKNGEKIRRDWLLYSPSSKAVFCYICKLYSSSDQALCKNGFSDWRNVSKRLSSHENSPFHRESVYSFSQRSAIIGRIDCSLVEQHKAEGNYWKQVLYRVVAVVKFISQRGLPFFGTNETFGSVHNGNFLGIIELLSTFDLFLAEHITTHGNKGKGKVSYFSSTIVGEFIELMSKKVLDEILAEIKKAKYFGIIVDSTPDITHTDQLSLVLRYVDLQGNPIERFLKFIPIHGHSSQHLQEVVVNTLQDLGIDLKYCRGQSYDNASNMSGRYSGLQARLKKNFPLIEYVPCAAHSLNLVGTNAAESCSSAVSFFGLVQSLYNFFSASTHRWELLSEKIDNKLTLKSLSTTRWSASADAVKVLKKYYTDILSILSNISKDVNESAATRSESRNLFSKMKLFEFALMVVIWDTILQRMNSVNKTVQSVNCEMSCIVPLYESLENFIKYVRDNFESYENEAEQLAGAKNYESKRKRVTPKSKLLDDSGSANVQLSPREKFLYQTHYVICDSIIMELNKRKHAYSFLESRFGFMCSKSMSREDIKDAAKQFFEIYSDDIDEEFSEEFVQFSHFISKEVKTEEKLKMIKSLKIEHTFPSVETAFRIMLSIPITNCSSERSFSVLKRIKNRLRSRISEKNLSGLSLLTIESDLTGKISFDDIIEQFALAKSRKKPM